MLMGLAHGVTELADEALGVVDRHVAGLDRHIDKIVRPTTERVHSIARIAFVTREEVRCEIERFGMSQSDPAAVLIRSFNVCVYHDPSSIWHNLRQ